MDDVVLVESDDSEVSVVEVEVPRKPTPPLIQIEDEEIILNVTEKKSKSILAKDFIEEDNGKLTMTEEAGSSKAMSRPSHWTPDMIKFYDDDWGDEDQFIVEKIQEKMDKSPSLWEISMKDLMHVQSKLRSRKVTCWNCREFGHNSIRCPNPPHVVKCHMCGTEGHGESSCPDSKCLNCGNPSDSYVYCCFQCRSQSYQVCSRCRLLGHNYVNCPDHWRLFHSTTGTTSVTHPKKQLYKLDKDMWCCNCGKQGHHQVHCMQRKNFGGFMDTLPFVVSYKKAFNWAPVTGKKKKGKEKHKNDNTLRLNPMNKAIRKDKTILKNKLRMFKRRRRRKGKREAAHAQLLPA